MWATTCLSLRSRTKFVSPDVDRGVFALFAVDQAACFGVTHEHAPKRKGAGVAAVAKGAISLLALVRRQADGRAYRKYIAGTTTMFRSVEVIKPQRITMAIGV